jgi:class I lanthipeptide synthase
LRLGRTVAQCPASDSGVKDCGLCHGAAGVAHLFNRLFQATGEPLFKTAAVRWFGRTLQMRRPSQDVAGFFALEITRNKRWRAVAKLGLLEGATGVALALLAAATEVEPNWDRMMLTALPPEFCLANGRDA